jgi:hypothetical protein
MGTLTDRISSANALGRQNLSDIGVNVPDDATTYDIMQSIADISGGGSQYTSIVYNEDNTITLTDTDGVVHTMECEYADGELTSVKYDGRKVALTYDGDVLVKVGKTEIDMSNAQTIGIEPVNYTVKFMVDGEAYEVVSVKSGNSVTTPKDASGYERLIESPNGNFDYWHIDGNKVTFPYVPTNDVDIEALILTTRGYLIWEPSLRADQLGSKNTSEFAVLGYCYFGNKGSSSYLAFAVGKTATSVGCSNGTAPTAFEYEGNTWYYSFHYTANSSSYKDNSQRRIPNCVGLTNEEAVKKILDYYYMKIDE